MRAGIDEKRTFSHGAPSKQKCRTGLCRRVEEHLSYGGQVKNWRYVTFKTIYQIAVERIQTKISMIDALPDRMRAAAKKGERT